GHDGDFHRVHQPRIEQAAEERAAAEQPDVLARTRPERGQGLRRGLAHDAHAREVLRLQRPREDEDLHPRHPERGGRPLERPAPPDRLAERMRGAPEVLPGFPAPPAAPAVRPGDVPTRARRTAVAPPPHAPPPPAGRPGPDERAGGPGPPSTPLFLAKGGTA